MNADFQDFSEKQRANSQYPTPGTYLRLSAQSASYYKAFVFDFDGVLADSVEVKAAAFARLFEAYGTDVQQRVVEHHRKNGGMTRAEKIRHYFDAFLGRPLDDHRLRTLCDDFANLVVDNVAAAAEMPGARRFLEAWHGRVMMFVELMDMGRPG